MCVSDLSHLSGDGLGEAVDSGLVRAAGVSNYGSDAMRACAKTLASRGVPLSSNQIQLSLLYPYALSNGLVDTCNELGVQVMLAPPGPRLTQSAPHAHLAATAHLATVCTCVRHHSSHC